MSHDACSSNLLTAAVTEHSPDLQRSDIDSTIPLTTAIIDDDDDDNDDDDDDTMTMMMTTMMMMM